MVKSKRGEFNRNVDFVSVGTLSNLVEEVDVVLGGSVGFFDSGDIFSEEIKADVVALLDKIFGGGDGSVEGFTGDKTIDDGAKQFGIFDKLFNWRETCRFEDKISEEHRR